MTIANVTKPELAQHIADELVAQLDEWYSLPETFDNELDTMIHRWYANAPKVFPKRPYFSPSAADSCPRELYYKNIGAKRDSFRKQPHQGRWTEIGTAVGDVIQRTILAMERNLKKKSGVAPRFRFERTDKGEPMFEDFAKRNVKVTHKDKDFYLFGTCDGIMEYISEDGEIIRVGLEIKSKQTSNSRTSHYSMRAPEEKHIKQCYVYSEMYNVDYYVILYVNTSHKSWIMSEDDYEKTPDIRAFGIYITDEDRAEVLDRFVDILESIEKGEPLPLQLDKFTFNGYKTIIAEELTDEEFEEIRIYANKVARSNLSTFQKNSIREAFGKLAELRNAES